MQELKESLYKKRRYLNDFELVSCDWETSTTGEKKLQSIIDADIANIDYEELLHTEGDFEGVIDLSNDELRYTIVFKDNYTKTKYTVLCGFYAGVDVEYKARNTSYFSKWDTPEDPTEISWDEDIEYVINPENAWGSKYNYKVDDISEVPPYSILSVTAEIGEGSKYSTESFNDFSYKSREKLLDSLCISVYTKDRMFKEKIMDYYFYNLIRYVRHTEY